MSLVDSAIQSGRCSLAVSGALLRDADVMLALTQRGGLSPMTLDGPVQAPIVAVGDRGLARSIAAPGGVLVLVEPGQQDQPGLTKLGQLVASAANKPTIVFVAKSSPPFTLGMMFRGSKIEHVKARGKDFLAGLALPPAELEPLADIPKAKDRTKPAKAASPRQVFVGREEEQAQLVQMLGAGGPIVLSGPRGVGKSSLIEHAVAEAALTRLPDLTLSRSVGFDTLLARLAEITRLGGSSVLVDAIAAGVPPVALVEAAGRALSEASGTEGQVMVVHNLQGAAGRAADFFRKSRLELLLEALLTQTYPLRLVFTSLVQPVFFREGRAASLRRLTLGGIKGRFYHDVFEAYFAPEFPRDKFGPMAERLLGHPMAVRACAIAARDDLEVVDSEKFLKAESLDDHTRLLKHLEKRVEKLSPRHKAMLVALAHYHEAFPADFINDMKIPRDDRSFLLGEGLLEMVGTVDAKRYRVHRLVHQVLDAREVSDFKWYEELSARYAKHAATLEGVEKLAAQQEANRYAVLARSKVSLIALPYPDDDAVVDSAIGLIRGNTPRFDMAQERLAAVLQRNPSNADAHLVELERLRHVEAKAEEVTAAQELAVERAAVPEIFHEIVGYQLGRKARGKAISTLEQGVAALPDQSRLRTRLASLLLRQGRRPEAIEHLRAAMELDPMLPDAYGLLGMARREEGTAALDEAETLLREAVRLAPGDVVQASRLVWLLLDIAKGVPERAASVRTELRELLDGLLQADKTSWEAHLLYAVAVREEGSDLERAAWFLKKARKLAPDRRAPIHSRIDVEFALLDLANGKLDEAEAELRKQARKDPTNHRVFAALSQVLEARGQYVAAHAELQRAAERTSPHSLDRDAFDADLERLRALVEADANAMLARMGLSPTGAPLAAAPASSAAAPEQAAATDEAAPEASAPDEQAAAEQAVPEQAASEEAASEEVAESDDGLDDYARNGAAGSQDDSY